MFPPPGPPGPTGISSGAQSSSQPGAHQGGESPQQGVSPSSSGSSPAARAKKAGETPQTPPTSTASPANTNVEALPQITSGEGATIPATTKKRTRGAAKAGTNGVNGERRLKRSKVTRSAVNGKEREMQVKEVVIQAETASGEEGDADANGSGNESSA